MADVILINPDLGFWGKYREKEKLPQAVLLVGTALYNKGYDVKIIDQRIEKEWKNLLLSELKKSPICVGISSMTGTQILNGLEIAKFVKSHAKTLPIVWGGIHPTLMPEQTLENKYVDFVVRGEGEETMVELTKAIEKKNSLKKIKGISYKSQGKSYHNPDREFIDLNKQPPINYDLVNIEDYIIDHLGCKMINFMTSRGCPYGCEFCYSKKFHKRKWRSLNVENTINQISTLTEKYGVRGFLFDDDEFFVNMERARELMKRFKEMNIKWASRGARVDSILKMDNEFLTLLVESGCNDLAIGAESGSDKILSLMNKRITREDIIKANRKLSKYNIISKFNFMVGLPTESIEDVKKTISLALKIKKENKNAMGSFFSIFTPYPGCELFELSKREGLKVPSSLEGWAGFHYEVNNSTWMSEKMKKIIEMLAFTSSFINDKFETTPKPIIELLSKFYRPIARYRFKNLFYQLPFEIMLANKLGLYESKPKSMC